METLFHGSHSPEAPVIKVGSFALIGDNLFDGLFASYDKEVCESHGDYVHAYQVKNIADNSDLNNGIEQIIEFLSTEIDASYDDIEELANAICDDQCDDRFSDLLNPRSCFGGAGAAGWEMQRLRGQCAKVLGFDAVKMKDEHGISYLIVKHNFTDTN